ncbi:MAG: hypothetical protein H6838_13060 [Planctomycetes bacterium]|nr:hypothetical protein [Planctomycetota bacterium]MCB9886418.1 hypothetical protein [Planctomycetota bacterium]
MTRLSRVGAAFAALVFSLVSGASASAQNWRSEAVVEASLQFDAPDRLERLPMQLGESAIYQRARLRPKDDADFVRAQYYWYCDVYSFSKKDAAEGEVALPEGVPPEMAEQLKKLLMGRKMHHSFRDWLAEQDKVTIVKEGKPTRGKNGKLDYWHWVYTVESGFGPCGVVYCEAAVYDFEDREVALVIEMPLESKKPGKPKSKWSTIINRVIRSGEKLEASEDGDEADKKRDKYADTPEKQAALAAAKANIAGLQGWDYFTQPNYVVIYSWDFTKPSERFKAKKEAEFYAERIEKMRALYMEYYPLDATGTKAIMPDPKSIPTLGGPITGVSAAKPTSEEEGDEEPAAEKLGVQPYSVFRLCATYEQFQKYGQSPPGVVGWYSPTSKELVVFLGGDQMMGSGATETVTYHEGWHQYADFYFHHPDSKKHGVLHRWFDEGHGDFFGSFRWGMNGWKYVGSKMRYDDVKNMARVGDYVPFKDIVNWDRRRFYSERAPYYYAQAYSMIDFLRRAEKSRDWEPRYGEILDDYRKVMLYEGDGKLSVDTAFREFKDEDWKKLEEAWKAWVTSNHFMNGR